MPGRVYSRAVTATQRADLPPRNSRIGFQALRSAAASIAYYWHYGALWVEWGAVECESPIYSAFPPRGLRPCRPARTVRHHYGDRHSSLFRRLAPALSRARVGADQRRDAVEEGGRAGRPGARAFTRKMAPKRLKSPARVTDLSAAAAVAETRGALSRRRRSSAARTGSPRRRGRRRGLRRAEPRRNRRAASSALRSRRSQRCGRAPARRRPA